MIPTHSVEIPRPSEKLMAHWPMIRDHFKRVQRTSGFVSIGTVRPDGSPWASPVGSLILNDDGTGYYLEAFTTSVARRHAQQSKVVVMGANAGNCFFLRSLFKGKFERWPGIRLVGTAGPLRPGKPEELERFLKLVRPMRFLKGYPMLWGQLKNVRELYFEDFEPVHLGKMTAELSRRF